MSPRVALVVVNFRSADDTIRCVRSFEAVTEPLDVYVVENGSGDDSGERLKTALPQATIVSSDRNLGYAGGNNLGMRAAFGAGADCVLVVNPDTEVVEPGFVTELAAALDADPGAGIAGPLVELADGSQQPTSQRRPSFSFALALALFSRARRAGARTRAGRVATVNGVCLMITREAFEATGGFDERYFMYGEEADLAKRAEQAGFHALFVPVRSLVHFHGSDEVRGEAASRIRANFVRFCFEHRGASSGTATALLFLAGGMLRRRPASALRSALDDVVPGGSSVRSLLPLTADTLLLPALAALAVLLLACGSSRVAALRTLGSAGKFAALGAMLIVAAIATLVERRAVSRARSRLGAALVVGAAVFMVISAASIAWSVDASHSAHFLAATVLLFGGALAGAWRVTLRPGGAKALAQALVGALTVIVVVDAAAFVVDHTGSFAVDVGTSKRFRGVLESPNTIAAYSFLFPLALWALLRLRHRATRVVGCLVILAYLVEIGLSGTRLALGMVVLVGALFVAAAAGGRRAALLGAGAVLVVSAGITTLAITHGSNDNGVPRYLRPSSVPTLSGRTQAWAAAAHLIAVRPIAGYGIGSEESELERYQSEQATGAATCLLLEPLSYCGSPPLRSERLADFSGQYVHNSFLGLAVQLGAPVAVAWALILLAAVSAAALAVRRGGRLRAALVASAVGGLVWACYSTYLWSPGNVVAAPFWILLAASLARETA
jgi:N-acetylglucosaminyl-diphospho-decaprenol L-rhamnosyltransferase